VIVQPYPAPSREPFLRNGTKEGKIAGRSLGSSYLLHLSCPSSQLMDWGQQNWKVGPSGFCKSVYCWRSMPALGQSAPGWVLRAADTQIHPTSLHNLNLCKMGLLRPSWSSLGVQAPNPAADPWRIRSLSSVRPSQSRARVTAQL
jgi:hypothetical protein